MFSGDHLVSKIRELSTDRLGLYKYFVCRVSVFQLLVGYAQLRPIRNSNQHLFKHYKPQNILGGCSSVHAVQKVHVLQRCVAS